jgi:hypothetical protein
VGVRTEQTLGSTLGAVRTVLVLGLAARTQGVGASLEVQWVLLIVLLRAEVLTVYQMVESQRVRGMDPLAFLRVMEPAIE